MQAAIKQVVAILQGDVSLQTLLAGTSSDKKIYPAIPDQFESFPCVTYDVITGGFRSVPMFEQDITLQLSIYTNAKASSGAKQVIENIYSRIISLVNYYNNDSNNIVYMKLVTEADMNDTDRQMYMKALRFQLWTLN